MGGNGCSLPSKSGKVILSSATSTSGPLGSEHLAGNRCWHLWGRYYLARPRGLLPPNTKRSEDGFKPPEGNDAQVSTHQNTGQVQSPNRHAH